MGADYYDRIAAIRRRKMDDYYKKMSDMRRRIISIACVDELYQMATFEECEILDAIVDRMALVRMAEGEDK